MACKNCESPEQDKLAYCQASVKDPPVQKYATMRCPDCGQFFLEYLTGFNVLVYKPVSIRRINCQQRAKKGCRLMKKMV